METKQSPEDLCNWLCTFFAEVKKSDGTEYCPRSVSGLLSGIQRYIESKTGEKVNFQDETGSFKPLHVLLENLFHELHKKGVGAVKAQAQIITPEEEKQLWACGVMGTDNPTSLLHSIFYYNGINFTLREGEEHRNLKLSQLIFGTEPSENDSMQLVRYVIYNEYVSKNRPGGKKQLNLQNNRCHVYLLEL